MPSNRAERAAGTSHKLLLITASSPEIQQVRRARVLNFQQITMPYLAAFVPPDWEVTHVDEAVTPVDPTADADLVGITFHTPSAFPVYELAAAFRSLSSIARRLSHSPVGLWWTLPLNLAYAWALHTT
jgi:hypothetical protein